MVCGGSRKLFPIVPCIMSDLSGKFPEMRFSEFYLQTRIYLLDRWTQICDVSHIQRKVIWFNSQLKKLQTISLPVALAACWIKSKNFCLGVYNCSSWYSSVLLNNVHYFSL